VIRYAGVMVDVPIVARARRILARAAAIEARNSP
jgi:citrate lyase beta subunit